VAVGCGAAALTHAELEEQVDLRGPDLLRQMYQDHLDLRAAREQRRGNGAGSDGMARTRVEQGQHRPLAMVFGQVTVTRIAYRAPGAANVHPADAELNLPEEKHSHGLRKLAAIESPRGSSRRLLRPSPAHRRVVIGKRQAEQLARRVGADVDGFYAARKPGPRPDDELLALTFDGKGIVMRPEALRPATAKAAAASRQKLAIRLSPEERTAGSGWPSWPASMTPSRHRTPDDIITPPGQNKDGRQRRRGPTTTGKWLTCSVTSDNPAVAAGCRCRRGKPRRSAACRMHAWRTRHCPSRGRKR
jgi:hypothetical protein